MPWADKKRFNLYYIYEQDKKENPMPKAAFDAVAEYINEFIQQYENENKNKTN